MIVIGLLALLLATLEHRSALQTLRLEYPAIIQYPTIPRSRAAMLAAIIAILGLLALFDAVLPVRVVGAVSWPVRRIALRQRRVVTLDLAASQCAAL
jgi:hypothetical protein